MAHTRPGISCQNRPSPQGQFHWQSCNLKNQVENCVAFSVFSTFFQYKNDNDLPKPITQRCSPARRELVPYPCMHPPHAIHSHAQIHRILNHHVCMARPRVVRQTNKQQTCVSLTTAGWASPSLTALPWDAQAVLVVTFAINISC